ncbi:hypothetical protein Pfo_030880 [Paulownia fortunei]|nr:hypothetical protein Pfo_030880 [Paulownia fortunei]
MENFYGLIAGSAAAAPGIPSRNASCNMSHLSSWIDFPLQGRKNTYATVFSTSGEIFEHFVSTFLSAFVNLDPTLIKGKIVMCTLETIHDNRREKVKDIFVKQGSGEGIILVDPIVKDLGVQFVLILVDPIVKYLGVQFVPPGIVIGLEEAEEHQAYMAAKNTAMGPNIISPDVIKPEITAPGVNILAARSPQATGGISLGYNIISGTSMSCPRVSAIVKSCRSSWNPAAIKSAIMTTATVLDNTKSFIRRHPNVTQASPFDYGSGLVHPAAAINPVLIYDFDTSNVIDFLCSASPAQLKNLNGEMISRKNTATSPYDFNYPSIMSGNLAVERTVTYYGEGPTVYKAEVEYPAGVNVSVTPNEQRWGIMINFTPYKTSYGDFVSGAFTGTNGIHTVRSPIGLNVLSVHKS